MDDYQRALLAHVEELAPRAENHVVDSVYIGGGTPSYYGADRIKALLKLIRKKYRLSRDCEITMEANPDSIDRKAFAHLRRAGVNRFSLGVQSASSRELKEVGRPHSFQQVREAVEAGADIIMLDNMTTEEMREAIALIDGRAETECSGNVTRENIARIIDLGVDYVSSGALTHSAPILDISMKNLHVI